MKPYNYFDDEEEQPQPSAQVRLAQLVAALQVNGAKLRRTVRRDEEIVEELRDYPNLRRAALKWLAVALVTGVCCGVVGSLFHIGVERATELREQHPWLLWCLPAAGLVIVAFYKLTKTEGQGTNDIIDAVHHGKPLSIWLLPAIFLGTILTHLCGGSAGREGAALQMGGTVGQCMGRVFHLDDKDLRVATLAGMAAFFSALFGTPLAATVFAIMVISIGVIYHVALYPSLLAALVAYGVSLHLGVEPTRFSVEIPAQSTGVFIRVAVLGVLCAVVSIVFCVVMHGAGHLMKKIKSPWLRVACGGVAVIVLTLLFGWVEKKLDFFQ